MSAFIILMVPGSALQVAAAREVRTELAAGSPSAGAGVRRWLARLALTAVALAVIALPLRQLLAAAIDVDQSLAA